MSEHNKAAAREMMGSAHAAIGVDMNRRTTHVCVMAIACSLLFASGARAATATVGQLPLPNASTQCTTRTILQTGASGNSYTVPFAGVITSWSFYDGSITVSGLKLKVGRPAGGGNFTIIGEAAAGTQAPLSVNGPYPANIPVQAGDVIGIYTQSGDCFLDTGNGSDAWSSHTGDLAPGTLLVPDNTGTGNKLPVSAQLQPPPGINLISPSSGSIKGGTPVTIAGHDFQGVSVSFGGVPAASFVVNSDSEITAVSPSASAPGPVDVRVSTAAGTSPVVAADQFTYAACVVPRLKGKTLKKATRRLGANGCRLGNVKGPRRGKIKGQTPKPGTVLPPGSKVKVKLG